jgi:hypothetical protein
MFCDSNFTITLNVEYCLGTCYRARKVICNFNTKSNRACNIVNFVVLSVPWEFCFLYFSTDPLVIRSAYFGAGKLPIHDVNCTGTEISLPQCPPRSRGSNKCSHSEDVGISCTKGNFLIFEKKHILKYQI